MAETTLDTLTAPAFSDRHEPGDPQLELIARHIRARLLEMSHRASTPHLGGALSCVETLVAAYWTALKIDPRNPDAPDRDRLIFSKGHAATALYTALAFKGFFPIEWLDTFAEEGSQLAEQPAPRCAPGVEAATGSLGHGLSLGVGIAMAGRIQRQKFRVLVIMSDGECQEGSVWEAAMMAAGQRLENIAVVVDYNKWQATGRSPEIMAMDPLMQKWAAFGWSAHEVDGHDVHAMSRLLANFPDGSGRPIAIVAHTVKGKGVSFIEDDNNWHYRSPTVHEVLRGREELGLV